jgi:hypothetical protein
MWPSCAPYVRNSYSKRYLVFLQLSVSYTYEMNLPLLLSSMSMGSLGRVTDVERRNSRWLPLSHSYSSSLTHAENTMTVDALLVQIDVVSCRK